jgi:hypothetical protein
MLTRVNISTAAPGIKGEFGLNTTELGLIFSAFAYPYTLFRDAVIGFPAHGAWRQVEAAMAARDVPAGESWTFGNHRTMAEVIAEETAA